MNGTNLATDAMSPPTAGGERLRGERAWRTRWPRGVFRGWIYIQYIVIQAAAASKALPPEGAPTPPALLSGTVGEASRGKGDFAGYANPSFVTR